MSDENPVTQEVKAFKKTSLKKCETQEKTVLPTQQDIDAEKKECKEATK